MTALVFDLEVACSAADGVARFRLKDQHGRQVGDHQVRLDRADGALWEGLFDTRSHVERFRGATQFTDHPATAEELLERLGVFLGQTVLGPKITGTLAAGINDRTLLIHFPKLTGVPKEDALAAAFARVPWEIARPAGGEKTLMERAVVVRAVVAELDQTGTWSAPPPEEGEPLRVLLVFGEAPGSRPLAMRLERETLLDLLYDEVMHRHQVQVDVLCHGVTRELLREQVESAGGYHVVHWSGHGYHDLLELYGKGGSADLLSGQELVDLFAEAGGFIPHLVFLSACLSGTFVEAHDWPSFRLALAGAKPASVSAGSGETGSADLGGVVDARSGYAGTALALLRAGVPQVVAMRYEVGDGYARDLAHGFYERLLAQKALKAPAKALALARSELLARAAEGGGTDYGAVDHATPLIFGRDVAPFAPPQGRSRQLGERRPQPQPLLPTGRIELDRPASFVGRGDELTELRGRWLVEGEPAVAVVQGLAGLGKTALVAEAIHLWHRLFAGVFAFQSKPTPLTIDEFLRALDARLALHSEAYSRVCDERPNARIYLPPGQALKGEERYQQLRDNLLEALRNEHLLLVLDNFETQLEELPHENGYACADPEWDRLLEQLAKGLPGTGSRLVLTSRHRLEVLTPSERAILLALGPLPMDQAVLFLQGTEELRRLAFGDEEGWTLARRLLSMSRGHPLILTRLGTLAGDRPALAAALADLETKGLGSLPDVFTGRSPAAMREKEREYLEDVAKRSVDLLIDRLSPDARRLLWVVTRASDPVTIPLLQGVWSGRSLEQEALLTTLAMADGSPEELREQLEQMPAELRGALTAAQGISTTPQLEPLVDELRHAGLLTLEGEAVGFHELVKERSSAWMDDHPEERGGRTDIEVWEAYGERYLAVWAALGKLGKPGALERAAEAGRRALAYLVRAQAFEKLRGFASEFVTATQNPSLLRAVIADLQAVANQVPAGRDRWSLRTYLADAFRSAGQPEAGLPLYEQAAAEAEAFEQWGDIGWICNNWANGLFAVGRLDAAKAIYARSMGAYRKAGAPEIFGISSEIQALRVELMMGAVERALPEIERHIDRLRRWWSQQRAGESTPEAPDAMQLARTLVGALDGAEDANRALHRWPVCLDLLQEMEEIRSSIGEGEHQLARTRLGRYGPLLALERLDEAKRLLEECLVVFRANDDLQGQAVTLTGLANLWYVRGDRQQAVALERQALAASNRLADLADRSISHGNLSRYLGPGDESTRHLLAGIAYNLLTGYQQLLKSALGNLAAKWRATIADGGVFHLPRLEVLLERAEFATLRLALEEAGVDLEQLQASINELAERVRRWVEVED